MLDLDEIDTKFQLAEKEGLCPVCGRIMAEVDRLREGDHVFIWFKCIKKECNGQWLQKKRCSADGASW